MVVRVVTAKLDLHNHIYSSMRECLTRGKLGDSLGALRDSVLGELTGEDEADSGLNFARSHGGLLVVAGQVLGLDGNLVKDILRS